MQSASEQTAMWRRWRTMVYLEEAQEDLELVREVRWRRGRNPLGVFVVRHLSNVLVAAVRVLRFHHRCFIEVTAFALAGVAAASRLRSRAAARDRSRLRTFVAV